MNAGADAASRQAGAEAPVVHASVYRSIVRVSSAVVCLIAVLVILGWTFDIEILRSGVAGLLPMVPLTAVGQLLLGSALGVAGWGRRSRPAIVAQRVLALGAAALGTLTLAEYILGIERGIDAILFPEAVRGVEEYPGRPAIQTGLVFVLAGFALWTAPSERRGRATAAQLAALGVLLTAVLALTGYAYGGEALYALHPSAPMSLPSATASLAVAAGILALRPDAGVVAVLTGDDIGGFTARRLLPAAVLVPFALGWARLLGQRLGLFDATVGLALVIVATMTVLGGFVWWSAAALKRLDIGRRRAEEAVRESEERLRTTLEALPIGVWFTDASGRLIYGNPEGRRIWAGARYVGPDQYDQYRGWWPDTGKRIKAHEWAMARALERRETSIDEEVEIEAFDGTHKLIRHSAVPVLGPAGEVRGGVVVHEDITARRNAERERERIRAEAERRAREEEALRRAAEAVSGAYTVEAVIARIAETALVATAASIALVGRIDAARGEVVVAGGAGAHGLPLGTRVPYAGSLTERVIERSRPVTIPRLSEDPRVPRILVDICGDCPALAVPMEAGGEAIGALILFGAPGGPAFTPDNVERARTFARLASLAFSKVHLLEKAEEGQRKLQRVLGSQSRLVRGFSHDVKNPLGAADGRLALLEEGVVDRLTGRQREELSRARRSIGTALRLIDSLIDFARAEAGQVTIRPTAVDVRGVVHEIAEEHRPSADEKGLRFEVELPGELPVIRSDPDRIRQILGNLVANAIRYTDAGGIRIRVTDRGAEGAPGPGRWIAVAVSDTGPGIPKDKQEAIFGEFVRLEPAKERGAGLGLAISRRLAHLLGGEITLESEVGEGSTFTLWLPVEGPGAPGERRGREAGDGDGGPAADSDDRRGDAGSDRRRRAAAVGSVRAPPGAAAAPDRNAASGGDAVSPAWSRAFLDYLEDYAIFAVDHEGRIVQWNRGAERMTGYRAEDVLGRPVSVFYPEEEADAGRPQEEMRIALEKGRFEEERWRLKADGTPFLASEILVPLRDESGRHRGFGKILRDLTWRHRAEAKLRDAREAAEAASRAESDFLALMSHELRTPLTAVIGYAELLEAGVRGPVTAGHRADIHRIKASARHLVALIEEILTYSRLESGREAVRPERVDLAALARETAGIVEPAARERGLAVRVDVPAEPVYAETDPGQVRRILLSILRNAVSFTLTGEVALTLEPAARDVVFRIRDTGIGIAPEDLERVFEPFWQAAATFTREVGGTGLGLTVARRLARLLGGDITVESRVGEGSTFTVALPRTAPARRRAGP